MSTVTVKNPFRSRKFGFGYNTSPSQKETGYYYEPPTAPYFVGTLGQVHKAIAEDRTFLSLESGGTMYSSAWFYDGKRITSVGDNPFHFWLNDVEVSKNIFGMTIDYVTLTLQD